MKKKTPSISKSIEISNESYEFVKSLISEIETQDNRITAYPILYMIQTKDKQIRPEEYSDEFEWYGNGESYSHDELIELLKDSDKIDSTDIENWNEWDISNSANDIGIEKVYFENIDKFESNIFFTEKAIKQHIKSNHYHYNDPKDYVIHAWRNPEVENIIKALKEIAKSEECK